MNEYKVNADILRSAIENGCPNQKDASYAFMLYDFLGSEYIEQLLNSYDIFYFNSIVSCLTELALFNAGLDFLTKEKVLLELHNVLPHSD